MAEPCDLTAVKARRLIGAWGLSPAELVESCIRRIDTWNAHVNAVVTTCYEYRGGLEGRAATATGTPRSSCWPTATGFVSESW